MAKEYYTRKKLDGAVKLDAEVYVTKPTYYSVKATVRNPVALACG